MTVAYLCMDCGVDINEINEYYMVHDKLWDEFVPELYGDLCISCLEKRMGRLLTPGDFTHYPVNHGYFERSDRMLNRLGLK